MTKRTEIFLGVALVIIGVICLFSPGEAQTYTNGGYFGGLNQLYDSTNIAPNEALVLQNLEIMGLSLKSRKGYSNLFTTAINTGQEIDEIYIYEPYSGTKRMVVATNGGVYITESLAAPGTVDWDTLALGWDGDSISVTNSSGFVYDLGPNDWWYSKLGTQDTIILDAVKYKFSIDLGADTIGIVSPSYDGATDTLASYSVLRKTSGTVSFTQEGDKLYICASNQPALVYDDTSYAYIALIDSGMVDDTTQLTDTEVFNTGKASHRGGGRYSFYPDSLARAVWDSSWVGKYFTFYYTWWDTENFNVPTDWAWTSTIADMHKWSSGAWTMVTETPFPHNWDDLLGNWFNYKVESPLANCVSDSGWAVVDSNKNWNDIQYGTAYLENFYAAYGNSGYSQSTNPDPSTIRRIYCNEINTFSIPWRDTLTYGIGGNYYVFTTIPTVLNGIDSLYKESPRFEQIFFYNKQLYGFGWDKGGYNVVRGLNYNRLWYSEIGESRDVGIMHRFIKPFFNLDLDVSEDISVMFGLRGRSYVSSNKSIWSFTGSGLANDLYLEKIISNNGIPDLDNFTKATEEYGYFANYNGAYTFNGIRADKISDQIDRLFSKYHNSRIVLGYFAAEQKLFLSFPDSNVTYFMDTRFSDPTWLGPWDFGMTSFYAPPDTNIFYFGHSEHKGRVFYYPNGADVDSLPSATGAISIVYESGKSALTRGPWPSKLLDTGYFPAQSDSVFHVDIFSDSNTVASDTFTASRTGMQVHRVDNLSADGDYFKVKISASSGSGVILRPYRLDYREADKRQGD